jgi:hypothetical protein
MACRLPFLLAVLVLALLGEASTEARADIGFAQAASTARIFNPGRTLVSMRRRVQNAVIQYNTGFIDAACASMYGTDLHGTTGFVIGTAVEPLVYPENIAMQDVLQRLPQVQVTFEQALALLRQRTGRADSLVERIDLASELFMIFYVVQYTDTTRYIIDAVSGEVAPATDVATPSNSISPAAYWQRILHARELSGADASWYPIFGATGHTDQGVPVAITFLNPANGRLKQVEMLGLQHQALEFSPVGHLLQVTSGLRGVVGITQVSAGQFLARIQSDFPGGKVADIGLQAQVNNTTTVVTWNATVLTAAGQSIVFSINAMVASGSGNAPAPDRPGDYNCDNHVTGEDLAELLLRYNGENCDFDLDQDGWVKGEDLGILLSNWG